jgi:hypothetical protein
MRRRARACAAAIVATLAAAALVAGCGGSSSSSSSSSSSAGNVLTVSPQHPQPSSKITFSFTSPIQAGIVGKVIDSYSLSVTGPAGANCKGSAEQAGTPVAKGATERISLGPAQLGTSWCAGPYTARVFEIQRPYCKPGVVCPQYVRVVGIIARTSFTISG